MGLSVQQLKEQLSAHGVDFSFCREKAELQQLLEEVEALDLCCAPDSGDARAVGSSVEEGTIPETAPCELSVKELKQQLSSRGVDYSGCTEKGELQELLHEAMAREGGQPDSPVLRHPLADGGFALHEPNGRRCWVEFVDGDDALCIWEDGTDGIVPTVALWQESELPGPRPFQGSFEEARAEAFLRKRLLVAAVVDGAAGSKAQRLMSLTMASEEVACLINENAVFWRGSALELREPHLQQLAPEGAPSLAMVLPLAVDAMRVLSHSQGIGQEVIVAEFVHALEEVDNYQKAHEARLISDAALLRMQQDEEFAESLARDQQAMLSSASSSPCPSPTHDEEPDQESPEVVEAEDAEQLTKKRRLLLDEFAAEAGQVDSSGAARLMLRLPGGQRLQRTFAASDKLSKVRRWVECCPWLPEAAGQELFIPAHFELCLAFPRRQLSSDEDEQTLAELGLVPSAALLLINGAD